ncbi:hypothetical protein ACFV4N_24730 [Actinosynnema sp. NPDC059797]
MGLRHAVEALVEHWDPVLAGLPPADATRLVELAGALARATEEREARRAATAVVRFLGTVLPEDHPVLLALQAWEPRLSSGAGTEWSSLSAALGARQRPAPTPEEVARGAEAWLLEADAVDERALRDSGQDPADPDLVRLERPDGGSQWPAFQFGPDHEVREVVRRVNRLLEADEDPWGVADWWLGENALLDDRVPAQLIGRVDDEVLIEAAASERAEP